MPSQFQASRLFTARGLLLLLLTLISIVAACSHSARPTVLGRYSKGFSLYLLFQWLTLALMLFQRQLRVPVAIPCSMAVFSTFAIAFNDKLADQFGMTLLFATIRLAAGFLLFSTAFHRYRRRQTKPADGLITAASIFLILFSIIDIGLWVAVYSSRRIEPNFMGYRQAYDLKSLTPDDIILTGDSFVWGDGVRLDERFGDVLETRLRQSGQPGQVFSLGVRGAGPARSLESLRAIPANTDTRLILFAFYPNDIEPAANSPLNGQSTDHLWFLARSSLAIRALLELRSKWNVPGLDAYHQMIISDFDPTEPTFQSRWDALLDSAGQLADEARKRSRHRPIFLIIPLMVDYHNYPLEPMHQRLGRECTDRGFEVLDLLPLFREKLQDGSKFRASPDNNHFNADVHRLVAEEILKRLQSTEKQPSSPFR